MGYFEEQLRNRIQNDDRAASENLRKLGDAVNGKKGEPSKKKRLLRKTSVRSK